MYSTAPAPAVLSPAARWIWDNTDPSTIERYYLRARRKFTLSEAELHAASDLGNARVRIFAANHFQVWCNGTCLGHGPAKAPFNEGFVNSHELGLPGLLRTGENTLEVLVHATGTGTMSAADDHAGLIFQIELPGGRIIVSDEQTEVCEDPARKRDTARRWVLPCIEDVDARQTPHNWTSARAIEHSSTLLERPIPLPSRRPLSPLHIVTTDRVRMPNFTISFRVKPYLVDAVQVRRSNMFFAPALIVTDLISESDQTIYFATSTGHVTWYYENRRIAISEGWERWSLDKNEALSALNPTDTNAPHGVPLRLKAGKNRLIGIHRNANHFESIHIAAFCEHVPEAINPFGAGGFQIFPLNAEERAALNERAEHLDDRWLERIAHGNGPAMNPVHTMQGANPQDRVVNAVSLGQFSPRADTAASHTTSADSYILPSGNSDNATRLILDLGAINNGHLAFTACGKAGSKLTFSFFEALEPGSPLRIIWPGACNNALVYQMKDGWQTFESLLPYGVRYICICHEGENAVHLKDVRFNCAHCAELPSASILTGDVTLDAIHAMCEQTLVAATDDTLTDCPTYEAVNWNFDNRLGTMADMAACRSIAVLRNTIEQYTRDPEYPALVRCHTPSTCESRIPVFSFHWIILCRDFHWDTLDNAFLQRVFPQVKSGLEEAIGMIDANLGLMCWKPWDAPWHLIDWAQDRDDNHEIVSAEQALLIGALEAGEYIALTIGGADNEALAQRWQQARQQLKAGIENHLWVAKRDAFADSLHADGSLSTLSSQVSNAALALYDIGSPEWQTRLHQRIREADPSLPAFGSPMGLFYVLEYLDKCNDAETIFRIIRAKWSAMLLAGDKTAWEQFPEFTGRPDMPTRSRCHPFATYILKYYVKYLLGIRFTTAGQQSAICAPNPPQGITAVQGSLPVADGWIRVSWKTDNDNQIQCRAEAPPSVSLTAR